MKMILIPTLILLSIPALAAKIKNANCADVATINEDVTPKYLAVIDGYNKAGKKVSEEVDMAGFVSDARNVKQQCAQDQSDKKVDSIRREMKSGSMKPSTKTTMNPVQAKCQDFISLGEEVQPVAVYWVAGHDKTGKVRNGEVDEEFLERPIATLVQDCKDQPTASFYSKTKAWLKKTL